MNPLSYMAQISNSKADILVTCGTHILHYAKSLWGIVKTVLKGKSEGSVIYVSR